MTDTESILRRLEELERENQKLKAKIADNEPQPKETTSHVSMFKGHPIITFSGPFRPFSIGLKKASVILEKIDDVRYFVENNKKYLGVAGDEEPS